MKKMTPEHKAKWMAAMAKHYADPEYMAKMADARRGKKRTPEQCAKISAAKKGKPNGLKGRKWTKESRLKASASAKARGENHNFHKDGKGHERDSERRTAMKGVEYRLWRESVFERDDFTCQECGERGGKLHADHIKRWKDYPELRFDTDNGRTLCEACHLASETYGNRRVA